VLFAVLTAANPAAARLFAELVQRDASVLNGLTPIQRAVAATKIESASQAAFFCIAAFSTIGLLLAWSLPVRRI